MVRGAFHVCEWVIMTQAIRSLLQFLKGHCKCAVVDLRYPVVVWNIALKTCRGMTPKRETRPFKRMSKASLNDSGGLSSGKKFWRNPTRPGLRTVDKKSGFFQSPIRITLPKYVENALNSREPRALHRKHLRNGKSCYQIISHARSSSSRVHNGNTVYSGPRCSRQL